VLTMSALPRLLNCTASAVLSRAETASEWANSGNDEHEDLAELDDPEHEFAHLLPPGARSEVKVAYDVLARTGRIIGQGDGRGYGTLGPFEIAGSIDVLWLEGDTVVVLDWKTGYNDVDPAERNWQLWGYALAACAAFGKSRARVMIVYTKFKSARPDEYEIDALELADFASRLAALHTRVPELKASLQRGELLDTKEGNWCRHCPSKHVCPSKNGLLVQFAENGLAVVGDAAMTPERARQAYEQFVRIDQLVADVKKRLNAFVIDNGPIDLGNGRMYGRYHRKGNEVLDGKAAVRAIREIAGESAKEFEAEAVEVSTSKAAIDRACKALNMPRGTKPKIERRIRELGGSTHKSDSMPIGEFDADRRTAAIIEPLDFDDIDRRLKEAG